MHYSQDINVMVRQIIPIWLNFNKNGWYVPSNKIAKMLPWHQCQWLILVPALGYWQVTGSPYGGARYNFRVVRGRGGVAKLKVLSGAKVYGSWKLPSVWESVRFGIRKKNIKCRCIKRQWRFCAGRNLTGSFSQVGFGVPMWHFRCHCRIQAGEGTLKAMDPTKDLSSVLATPKPIADPWFWPFSFAKLRNLGVLQGKRRFFAREI